MVRSRITYATAAFAGFVLAIPAAYAIWAYITSIGIWRFLPLAVFPILGLVIAMIICKLAPGIRESQIHNADMASSKTQFSVRHPNPKRTVRIAAIITVFLIPFLMLCFLPCVMMGQLPMDFWPNLLTLVITGFVVSIPMAYLLYLASNFF